MHQDPEDGTWTCWCGAKAHARRLVRIELVEENHDGWEAKRKLVFSDFDPADYPVIWMAVQQFAKDMRPPFFLDAEGGMTIAPPRLPGNHGNG